MSAEKGQDLFTHFEDRQKFCEKILEATHSNTYDGAIHQIQRLYKDIDKFGNRLNSPFNEWPTKVEQIIKEQDILKAQNQKLIAENEELKLRLNLQVTKSPTDSMKLLYNLPPRGIPRTPHSEYSRATNARGDGVNQHFQCENQDWQNTQQHQPSTRSWNRPENHQAPLQSESSLHYGLEGDGLAAFNLASFAALFKSQRLPPLEPFTGREGDFEEFVMQFENRFSRDTFSNLERRDAFIALLAGITKNTFKSMDEEIRKGHLDLIIQKLKTSLKKDENIEGIKAKQWLDNLTLDQNRLQHYCDELEKLTKKIHLSLPMSELSFERALHLYNQVKRWSRATDALRILEQSSRATVYSDMKKLVFEWDRNRINAQTLNSESSPWTRDFNQHWNQNDQNPPYQDRQSFDQNLSSRNQQVICYNCNQPGHISRQCPQTNYPDNVARTSQYFQHTTQRNNYPNQNSQQPKNNGSNKFNRQNFTSTSGDQNNKFRPQENRSPVINRIEQETDNPIIELFHQLSGISVKAQMNAMYNLENNLPYYGKRPVCDVKVGLYKCRSLIDSGAEPSAMTVEVFKTMVKALKNPDEYMEVI